MRLKLQRSGLFITLISICLFLGSFSYIRPTPAYNSLEILNGILESTSKIKTLRYDLQRNERLKGTMTYTESRVKLQLSPRKLYISLTTGQEVLWVQGANNGNALVNPGSFPYMNLNLDPMGSLMRKGQHHTINELGMEYLADILRDGMKHSGEKLAKQFVVLGEEKYTGHTCYKISIAFPDFAWLPYTIKKGENILSVAGRLHISEYMILENNPKATWYTDVKEGQIIQVPNAYAKLILLMVDKESMLPISEKIFDDKGLFESYEYLNLQVNSAMAPEEFTKGFKGYHF